jgi:hypothetical protein
MGSGKRQLHFNAFLMSSGSGEPPLLHHQGEFIRPETGVCGDR